MSMPLSCLLPTAGPYKFAMRPLGATTIEISMYGIFYSHYTKLFYDGLYAHCSINKTPAIVKRGPFIIDHISKMF